MPPTGKQEKAREGSPVIKHPRRKRGKSKHELAEEANGAEIHTLEKGCFYDVVDEALVEFASLRRKAQYMRRKFADNSPLEKRGIGEPGNWPLPFQIAGRDFRRLLRVVAVWMSRATGFAGATAECPELAEAWKISRKHVELLFVGCLAKSVDPAARRQLAIGQVLVEKHNSAVRRANKSKRLFKGVKCGKAGDALGDAYVWELKHHPKTRDLKVTSAAALRAANRLGLESGNRTNQGERIHVSPEQVAKAEEMIRRRGWFAE